MSPQQLNLKKPENRTRCLVTFSKRKSSLIKKARNLSVSCNIDIALVAFSPAARPNMFCSQDRIEDFLQRYINLPADTRNCHITNVKEKVRRLGQLAHHVEGDDSKLNFLDDKIKHMEQLIMKSEIELEAVEAYLRVYEPDPRHDPSPAELMRCEENLKRSLHLVTEKGKMLLGGISPLYRPLNFKMEVEQQYVTRLFPNRNFNLNKLLFETQDRTTNQYYVQCHNGISDTNSFHGSIFEASSSHLLNLAIPGSPDPNLEGIAREYYLGVDEQPGQSPVAFESSSSATLVRIQQFCTREASYYSAKVTTRENRYLAAAPAFQYPVDQGNSGSCQGLNSIPPLQYEQSSVDLSGSPKVSEKLSPSTIGQFFDSFSSFISVENELSAHLNHLVHPPLEEDPMDFDLPDLLSTEAMLVELESPSINRSNNEEGICWQRT